MTVSLTTEHFTFQGHKQLVLEGVTTFFNKLDETCCKEDEVRSVVDTSHCMFYGCICIVIIINYC